MRDLVFCSDESLDWALGEAEDAGQLNTWVSHHFFSLLGIG